MRLIRIALFAIMAALVTVSGCSPPEAVNTVFSVKSVFVGEWKMTRVSIRPEPPVPDLIVGMVLRGSPAWKITGNSDTGKANKISFDGRETWFLIPRLGVQDLSIDVKAQQVSEKSGSEMVASSGGTISVGRISIIGMPEFTDVVVNYQDNITMTIGEIEDVVNADAVLRIQVTGGSYTMDGQASVIPPFSATVTYTGTRPRSR